MTQIKYGPLWWKTRMGAQLQISCSAVLHFFRMNSKGLKPPPLGVEFLFHFKHHPASFELKSHPRILQAFSTRKSGAKNLLLCNPAFYCSLASSIVTDDKQQLNTSYLPLPLLLATSVLHYFYQRAIDYISDINGCATKTHKCSNEKVICLNSIG